MGGTVLQALFENGPRTDSAIQLVTDVVRRLKSCLLSDFLNALSTTACRQL
jgi:hypothetical protein